MSHDANELLSLANEAAEHGPDMNEAQSGGGERREPPAAGYTRLRLIEYIEVGVHEDTIKGQTKDKDTVWLGWELSGPKHAVEDGKDPHVIRFKLSLSLNEKAHFFKLFGKLNHTKSARHFSQLLGGEFLGTVVHNIKEQGEGKEPITYANLRDANGYTIRPPFREDDETGEYLRVTVDKPRSPLRLFIWNSSPEALAKMWDSIFIDGTWEGKEGQEPVSKNRWQDLIRKAKNFNGSPIATVLGGGDALAALGGAEKVERTEAAVEASADAKAGAAADPLAGM